MKIKYVIGILTILLLVGCASQVETPAQETPTTGAATTPAEEPVVEETAAEEVGEEVIGEAAVPTTEVDVTSAGFDPTEIKVSVGDTVTLTSTDNVLHVIRGNDLFTVRKLFRAGNQYQFMLDEAGDFEILDQTAMSTLKITVE